MSNLDFDLHNIPKKLLFLSGILFKLGYEALNQISLIGDYSLITIFEKVRKVHVYRFISSWLTT